MSKIHSYSWRKSASLIRDERGVKLPEKQRNLPANKNTKKWCKGKIGTEHFCKIFPGKYAKIQTLNCINCGKCIDNFYSFDALGKDTMVSDNEVITQLNKKYYQIPIEM